MNEKMKRLNEAALVGKPLSKRMRMALYSGVDKATNSSIIAASMSAVGFSLFDSKLSRAGFAGLFVFCVLWVFVDCIVELANRIDERVPSERDEARVA